MPAILSMNLCLLLIYFVHIGNVFSYFSLWSYISPYSISPNIFGKSSCNNGVLSNCIELSLLLAMFFNHETDVF